MIIAISEGRLHITFRVCDDRTVELADISLGERAPELPPVHPEPVKRGQFLAVHVTGESATGFHAGKHDAGSVSTRWRYISHRIE